MPKNTILLVSFYVFTMGNIAFPMYNNLFPIDKIILYNRNRLLLINNTIKTM